MATAKASANKLTSLEIKRPKIDTMEVPIRGTSPLIVHNWSEKSKKEMRDKQQKKATKAREARDPDAEYKATLYYHPDSPIMEPGKDAIYAFKSIAFKLSMVRAAKILGIPMTETRLLFMIPGEFVKIDGEPRKREDMVRLNGKTADLRYRAEFPEWKTVLPFSYERDLISAEQIINLVIRAGFSVGVGEWRPECDGDFGCFEIDEEAEV